jgi:hypothetical protein
MRFSQLRLKTCKECGCGRWPQPHLFVFLGLENKIIFLLGQKMRCKVFGLNEDWGEKVAGFCT